MNRKYELVYVVSPDATDDQVTELHTQVEGIVQRMGGQIEKTDNWGRRKLAYEIGHHKEGTYVLHVINGTGDLMKEIDRRLKVFDLVIRHLVVRVDEDEAIVERRKSIRTEESRRRRVARGLPPDRQPGEGQRELDDDRDDDLDRFDGVEDVR
jgi:small subunit ribosomal protein S6